MAEFSKELMDMLTDFLISEIGYKATEGITYSMAFKDNAKDKSMYTRYSEIKKETHRCGYMDLDVFRIYEVRNGYIFDMDLQTAKQINTTIFNSIAKLNNGETPIDYSIMEDIPEQRRKRDMVSLAKFLKHEFDNGKNAVDVALFSRNSTNRIVINGRGQNGDMLSVRYSAFAIRHWDLEVINAKLLIPAGFRVCRVKPGEVLPSKTGVSFTLTMERLEVD